MEDASTLELRRFWSYQLPKKAGHAEPPHTGHTSRPVTAERACYAASDPKTLLLRSSNTCLIRLLRWPCLSAHVLMGDSQIVTAVGHP